jgi:enoyl-CoA hydratase
MEYKNIIYEKRGNSARIILNRPEVLNALNLPLMLELKDALTRGASDDDVRVIILMGAGEKAFSAGVDIKGMNDPEDTGKDLSRVANEVINIMESTGKPIIAAVNGYVLTGGLELILAADMIIATQNSKFGDTHARWGLTPLWQGSQRLPRIVGPYRAKELFFTCEMISADEAWHIGLVNRVVSREKLEETIEGIIEKISSNSSNSIKAIKNLVNKGLKMTLEDGIRMAEVESPGRTRESFERTQAFRDKKWVRPDKG